jgi:hypothetical protein
VQLIAQTAMVKIIYKVEQTALALITATKMLINLITVTALALVHVLFAHVPAGNILTLRIL